MTYLSPEAQKARRNAAARDTLYWPTIARTSTKAIIQRPPTAHKRTQARVAGAIRENLPMFKFNSTRNWWESDLSNLQAAVEFFSPSVSLSKGAADYLLDPEKETRA